MKILILLPFAFYRNSGSSFSSYYRVKALYEINEKLDLICYPHGENINWTNLNICRFPKRLKFNDYEPGEWRKKIYYDFIIMIKSLSILFKKKYDLVFVHSTLIYIFAFVTFFVRSKFVATLHANIDGELEKWGVSKNNFLKTILLKFEKICLKRYNKVIVVSPTIRDHLINNNLGKNNYCVINNSVESYSVDNNIRKEDNNNFEILYTGTFVEIQNLELIYQTALLLNDEKVEFVLVGGTNSEIIKNMKIIEKRRLTNVKLIPRVEHEELKKYFNESDIVISPRTYGNEIPMKIYDYLNYGKCILASDAPIHKSILNNNVAYLVEGNSELFAEAILHIKDNPDKRKEIETKAKDYFESKFSYEMMINKYKKLLSLYEK